MIFIMGISIKTLSPHTIMATIQIQLAASTDVGLVRKNNEDDFTVCPDLSAPNWSINETPEYIPLGEYGTLLVVADGMGGANAGEVASSITISTIQEVFTPDKIAEVLKDKSRIASFLTDVVKTANKNIVKHSKEDCSTKGMGTTIVLAWILDTRAYVAWCGDSRCYVFNPNVGFSRLSKDHSFVQELVDKGELDPEMAFDHPYSNVITRCLGDTEGETEPDIRIYQLHDGDTLLLCSDGLCGYCRDEQISEIVLDNQEDMIECKNKLINAALAEGGYDNVTVAMAKVKIPDEAMPEPDMNSTLNPRLRRKGLPRFFFFFVLVACVIAWLYYNGFKIPSL